MKVKFDILTQQMALKIVKSTLDLSEVQIEEIGWTFNGKPLQRWLVMWLDEDHDEHTTELYVYRR